MASITGPQDALLSKLQKIYKSGVLGDFTIKAGASTFKGSKDLFCAESEFFKRALNGKEAKTSVIDLSAWRSDVVRAMVQHVYTNHYTLPFGVTQSFNKCRLQAQVYGLAMYVRMPSLQKSACSQFEACLDFDVQEGMAAATVVYGDTTAQDRGLRDVLVKHISQYSFKLLGYGEGTTENRAILRSLPHFAYDVAIQQAICASKPSRLLLPGYGSSELHCKGCNEIAFMPGLEDYRCPECWVLLERKPNGSLLRFLALLGAWGSKSSSQGWFTSIRLWLLGWRL